MAISRAVHWWHLVAVCAAVRAVSAQQPPADTARRDSLPAVLIGHVVDSTGIGLSGAEITLVKSDKFRAITGDSGAFRIAGLPSGTDVFSVRRDSAGVRAGSTPGAAATGPRAPPACASRPLPTSVADTATQTHGRYQS